MNYAKLCWADWMILIRHVAISVYPRIVSTITFEPINHLNLSLKMGSRRPSTRVYRRQENRLWGVGLLGYIIAIKVKRVLFPGRQHAHTAFVREGGAAMKACLGQQQKSSNQSKSILYTVYWLYGQILVLDWERKREHKCATVQDLISERTQKWRT